jgi:hypothetical protein
MMISQGFRNRGPPKDPDDLLVDDLHHLFPATAPPLDGQHGIIEGTHCSTGRIGQARSLHAVLAGSGLGRGSPGAWGALDEAKLVCEVQFTAWASDGRVRHPSFKGMREDKAAKEVRREAPK